MTKTKKYRIVLGRRIYSGEFIGYDGSSLIGCGVMDEEDLAYINNELDCVIVFGNVFKDNIENICRDAVDWLIENGAIGLNEKEKQTERYKKEIQTFIEKYYKQKYNIYV